MSDQEIIDTFNEGIDLRRSFVTRTRRLGVPESVVMRMSGHRARAVFDRYNIVSEGDLRDVAAAAARILPSALKAAVDSEKPVSSEAICLGSAPTL